MRTMAAAWPAPATAGSSSRTASQVANSQTCDAGGECASRPAAGSSLLRRPGRPGASSTTRASSGRGHHIEGGARMNPEAGCLPGLAGHPEATFSAAAVAGSTSEPAASCGPSSPTSRDNTAFSAGGGFAAGTTRSLSSVARSPLRRLPGQGALHTAAQQQVMQPPAVRSGSLTARSPSTERTSKPIRRPPAPPSMPCSTAPGDDSSTVIDRNDGAMPDHRRKRGSLTLGNVTVADNLNIGNGLISAAASRDLGADSGDLSQPAGIVLTRTGPGANCSSTACSRR